MSLSNWQKHLNGLGGKYFCIMYNMPINIVNTTKLIFIEGLVIAQVQKWVFFSLHIILIIFIS